MNWFFWMLLILSFSPQSLAGKSACPWTTWMWTKLPRPWRTLLKARHEYKELSLHVLEPLLKRANKEHVLSVIVTYSLHIKHIVRCMLLIEMLCWKVSCNLCPLLEGLSLWWFSDDLFEEGDLFLLVNWDYSGPCLSRTASCSGRQEVLKDKGKASH